MFTINNYTEQQYSLLLQKFQQDHYVQYVVMGKEVGTQQHTPHIQGYVQWKIRREFSTVLRFFSVVLGVAPHLDVCRGQPSECSLYCKKDNDFWEFGQILNVTQGSRTDLKELVSKYNNYQDVLRDYDNLDKIKFGWKVLCDAFVVKQQDKFKGQIKGFKKEIYWLCGPSGSGKTYFVSDWIEQHGFTEDYWSQSMNGKFWFSGYTGQTVAWFDEFRKDLIPWSDLLKALDQYKVGFETKGSSQIFYWIPQYIFITCVGDPWQCFSYIDSKTDQRQTWDNIDQLIRRISHIYQFQQDHTYVDLLNQPQPTIQQIIDELD